MNADSSLINFSLEFPNSSSEYINIRLDVLMKFLNRQMSLNFMQSENYKIDFTQDTCIPIFRTFVTNSYKKKRPIYKFLLILFQMKQQNLFYSEFLYANSFITYSSITSHYLILSDCLSRGHTLRIKTGKAPSKERNTKTT